MGDQIERVFYDVIKYLLGVGEISGDNLFIDGTKLEANANRYTFVWKKAVSKNEQKLRARLPDLLKEIHSAYCIRFPENTPVEDMIAALSSIMEKLGIDRVYGKGHHKSAYQRAIESQHRPRMLHVRLVITKAHIREQLRGLKNTIKMAQYELYNSLFDGRNSFSKTDIDATFMHMKEDHMKNGQLKPGYNI